jgi:hypothetical protein
MINADFCRFQRILRKLIYLPIFTSNVALKHPDRYAMLKYNNALDRYKAFHIAEFLYKCREKT